jgi:integrase
MFVTLKNGQKMVRKIRNIKGSVGIVNTDGRIRLRWSYQRDRYSLNLYPYTKNNLLEARKIALRIESDMVQGSFDPTLEKYKPMAVAPVESGLIRVALPEHFRNWVKNYRHKDCDRDIDYHSTFRMLNKWGDFKTSDAVRLLNGENIGPRTYNRRLTMLKAFFHWAVKNKIVDANPLEDVSRKKVVKIEVSNRKPFTQDEIVNILNAFKDDTCCPLSSNVKHSHYYPFVYFIFKYGVRNAEAIGLRVKYVDLVNRVVTISEVLARTLSGTHAEARIRKETKNGKTRQLPLDDETIAVLQPLLLNKGQDELVFLSPQGMCIDDKAFQRRIFRKVLKALNIENRVLYACRHTFNSRCIHEGLTPVMTAFLMGNNPETALRNYTHLIELPKMLPSITKG